MELQGRVKALEAQGLGLAVITYDPPAVLASFAERKGLTFPLLSDAGSKTIRAYGLLNREFAEGHKYHGVPHPGTFVLDARGVVRARHFEARYQERTTVARLALAQGSPVADAPTDAWRHSTRHLDLAAYASDAVVAPGQRFAVVLEVTPARGMHIYAPPQTDYRPIELSVTAPQRVKLHPVAYPKGEPYEFKPLNEVVQVYMQPIRLVQDVTLDVTPETRALASQPDGALTLNGVLSYQACDDRLCFPPDEVPVSWTVKLKPLER